MIKKFNSVWDKRIKLVMTLTKKNVKTTMLVSNIDSIDYFWDSRYNCGNILLLCTVLP